MPETKEFQIRTEGTAGRYGLGELVVPNVYLFKDGQYNLTAEELQAVISRIGKGIIR